MAKSKITTRRLKHQQQWQPHCRNDPPGQAKCKAKTPLKGAETRHLVPYGVELAEEMHATTASRRTAHLVMMMRSLLGFYANMASDDFSVELAATSERTCLQEYKELSNMSKAPFWQVKPKFHLFQELAEMQTLDSGNPRDF